MDEITEIDEPWPKKRKKTETFTTEYKDLEQVKQCENALCFDRRVQQITSCNAATG